MTRFVLNMIGFIVVVVVYCTRDIEYIMQKHIALIAALAKILITILGHFP